MTSSRWLGPGLALVALTACRDRPAQTEAAPAPPTTAGATTDAVVASTRPAPAAAVLDQVEVRLAGAAEHLLVASELGRDFARCLVDGERVVALARQAPPTRDPRAARVGLTITAEPGPDGKAGVALTADVHWRDGDEPAPSVTLTGDATPVAGDVDAAVVAIALQLRDGACRDLQARLWLWADHELAGALAGDEPGAALWALQLAAHRPEPALRDSIVRWLGREPALRDAAIAALVALRDPRSVAALTAITDMADKPTLRTLVDAVSAIGGDDARDFLEVMASHRDPAIASHARDGLDQLARQAMPGFGAVAD